MTSGDDLARSISWMKAVRALYQIGFPFNQVSDTCIGLLCTNYCPYLSFNQHAGFSDPDSVTRFDSPQLVTVKHYVNLNFSQFTKAYLSSLLQSTLGTVVTFEAMTPNSVTFTFESPLNHWRNNNGKNRIDKTNGRAVELQKKAV